MRIIFDVLGAQNFSRFRGISRYIRNLAKALINNKGDHEIFLLLDGTYLEGAYAIKKEFQSILPEENFIYWYSPNVSMGISEELSRKISKLYAHVVLKHEADFLIKGGFFTGEKIDDIFGISELKGKVGLATIVYDFIPKENPEKFYALPEIYNWKLNFFEKVDVLFAISEFTEKQCLEFFPEISVFNIGAAPDDIFISASPHEAYSISDITKPFVLYTGGIDERKNVVTLINAYSSLSASIRNHYQLVIVCGKHDSRKKVIQKNLEDAGLSTDSYVLLDFVSDNELLWLYSNCMLFCFPSLTEGFGLTPLEAMCCGAPTIASSVTSLPEVVGYPEALFAPTDKDSLARLLTRALTDSSFLERLRQNAIRQSKKFSWNKTAKKIIDVLSQTEYETDRVTLPEKEDIVLFCKEYSLPALSVEQTKILARCITKTLGLEPKKIFIDITSAYKNSVTGVQRVIRSVVDCLVKLPSEYEICPVYLTDRGYSPAHNFLFDHYGIGSPDISSDLHFSGNDIFLGLDASFQKLNHSHLEQMKLNGTKIYFFIHDLLPIKYPAYFPDGWAHEFKKWLEVISAYDGVVCNSAAVANEYAEWRRLNDASGEFNISWAHLGHDLEKHIVDNELPEKSSEIVNKLSKTVSILMVSTIDPRKGHRQSLAAFEKLWESGVKANLVIVGRAGWKMEDFISKLSTHPQKEKRLFWLSGISDEFLLDIYKACTGVLVASEGEGFGLSIIEGASYGKPLMLRDLPVFKEIAADHAFYFHGLEPENLSVRLKEWISLLEEKKAPSSDGIHKVTWMHCTKEILKAIGAHDFIK